MAGFSGATESTSCELTEGRKLEEQTLLVAHEMNTLDDDSVGSKGRVSKTSGEVRPSRDWELEQEAGSRKRQALESGACGMVIEAGWTYIFPRLRAARHEHDEVNVGAEAREHEGSHLPIDAGDLKLFLLRKETPYFVG